MLDTTAELGAFVLGKIWGFFNLSVPGFNFTFGEMSLGLAACSLSLLVLKMFFGIGGNGVTPRSGSTNKAKISENRKRDEY